MYKALSTTLTDTKDFKKISLMQNENLLNLINMTQGRFSPVKPFGAEFAELVNSSETGIRTQTLIPISSPFSITVHSEDYQVALALFGSEGYLGFNDGYKDWARSITVVNPNVEFILICITKKSLERVTKADFLESRVKLELGEEVTEYTLSIFDDPNYSNFKFVGSSPKQSDEPRDYSWELINHDLEKSSITYAHAKLKIDDYWDRAITGKGVKIGVIDNGIAAHDALPITKGLICQDLKYLITKATHGTHCIGIALARNIKNGKPAGIAPDADLYFMRMSYNTTRYKSLSIIESIDFAVENGIDIISISVGVHEDSTWDLRTSDVSATCPKHLRIPLRNAFIKAYEHGIIVVIAGGNGNDGSGNEEEYVGLLQKMPKTLAIANLTIHNERFRSSSVSRWVAAASYGTAIMSTVEKRGQVENSYDKSTGTSMSAPSFAGIVALYKQLFPKLNSGKLIDKILENCLKIPGLTEYEQGKGIPQPPEELYQLPTKVESTDKFRIYSNFCWQHVDCFAKDKSGKWKEMGVRDRG